MVDGAILEGLCRACSTVGSNPIPSEKTVRFLPRPFFVGMRVRTHLCGFGASERRLEEFCQKS